MSSFSAPVTPASPSTPIHPFANTKSLLTVIRDDHVDLEAEEQFLAEFEDDDTVDTQSIRPSTRTLDGRSVISHEIWLDDQSLSSSTFARNATISGWTCVGDQKVGAYVVYDCVITTKEGNAMHILKRYNDFVRLRHYLMRTLQFAHLCSALACEIPARSIPTGISGQTPSGLAILAENSPIAPGDRRVPRSPPMGHGVDPSFPRSY